VGGQGVPLRKSGGVRTETCGPVKGRAGPVQRALGLAGEGGRGEAGADRIDASKDYQLALKYIFGLKL
jgi:hypothetical protein